MPVVGGDAREIELDELLGVSAPASIAALMSAIVAVERSKVVSAASTAVAAATATSVTSHWRSSSRTRV